MKIKAFDFSKLLLVLTVFSLSFLLACGEGGDKQNKNATQDKKGRTETSETVLKDIDDATKVFRSLPSPVEMMHILEEAGITFNSSLLSPAGNANSYITDISQALNMGVYITDMSYSNLFDQSQLTLDYINAAKELADELGILGAIDQATVTKLENNINDKELIIDIISETLMNSSDALQQQGLESTAATVLIGGWVEGLYIATQLVGDNLAGKQAIVDRIADQKLSLENIRLYFEEFIAADPEDANSLAILEDIKALEEAFAGFDVDLELEVSDDEITTDDSGVTVIGTVDERDPVTPEVFNKLKDTVKRIRTSYIS